MPEPANALQRLQDHLNETRLLGSISSALYYDQNTVMPAAGAEWRGEQLALLASQIHARQSSARYAELVGEAEAELEAKAKAELGPSVPTERRRNLQLVRLELERQRCLDPALVASLARAQSKGNALWQTARRDNDFPTFAPALAELIALRREQAGQLAAAEALPRSPAAPGKCWPSRLNLTSARRGWRSCSPRSKRPCRACWSRWPPPRPSRVG